MSDQQVHTENVFRAIFGPGDHGSTPGLIKRNLPNAMTWTRMGLAIAFPLLPEAWWLPVLVVAALTEWLDGALSRWWGVESEFGRLLDPVADKFFVVAMLVAFVWDARISVPTVALVTIRDVVVALACLAILIFGDRRELFRMPPRILGKATTVFQFGLLLGLLIWGQVPTWFIVITVCLSAASAVDYVASYFR